MILRGRRAIAHRRSDAGMGLATSELLLSRGAMVSLADVNEKALQAADEKFQKANYPGKYMTTVLDVRKPKDVDEW